MPYVRNRLVTQYIILCEGVDTQNFIIQYLNSSELQEDRRFSENIQALDFGGIDNLSVYLGNLSNMEGYDKVSRILVLRDAETNVDTAIRSIRKALIDNNLPAPDQCNQWHLGENGKPNTAFTLLPSCSSQPVEGALEDLCWSILKDKMAKDMRNDVQDFIGNIRRKYSSIKSHEHKSRLHTYFSINEKYISLKIGEAAKAGAFDWNNTKLLPLKDIITEGFDI